MFIVVIVGATVPSHADTIDQVGSQRVALLAMLCEVAIAICSQGLDVLEVMTNIHIFVANY